MLMKNFTLETRCLSSLIKVFGNEELSASAYTRGTALANESYAFQVAYKRNGQLLKGMNVKVESDLIKNITIRKVGLVPSELSLYHDHDDHILRTGAGLFPDPLYPLDEDGLTGLPGQWQSIWVTINLTKNISADFYPIRVIIETSLGEKLGEETFQLEVVGKELPEQKLIHTHWLHTDCIATEYNVDVFSEAYWVLVDKYIGTAVQYGSNMILTPLFTPPLDTEVGSERPTVQLVDVKKSGDTYSFGFDKLKRWIELCNVKGVKYFELSHLFTQWGAAHAPKIIATENGESKRIFGWETDSAGVAYRQFLSQFLPTLIKFIKANQLDKRVYFHVSDEPHPEHLETYQNASNIISEYITEYPIIDALSDHEFYKKGIVKKPIPGSDHIEPFLEDEIEDLWTYYCCSQNKKVSNRFFAFPSARNRIIGIQLYKFNIAGFLQWGYNFWYSQYSRKQINPYIVTDADHAFASGDAFAVYPGENGPIISLRLEVFRDALQDMRALQLLESYIGKEKVVALLEEGLNEPITFKEYPREDEWILSKREQINQKIKELSSEKHG